MSRFLTVPQNERRFYLVLITNVMMLKMLVGSNKRDSKDKVQSMLKIGFRNHKRDCKKISPTTHLHP